MRTVYTRWAYNRDLRMMLNIPATSFDQTAKKFSAPMPYTLILKPIQNPIGFAEQRLWVMTTWTDRETEKMMEAFR